MKNNIVVNSLLLSSAIVAIGATDAYASQTGTVTASTLNIRSGAGTSYSVITKAYKGESVDILDTSNGWYKVKLSNGKIGWASSDYITRVSNSNSNSQNGTSISGYGKVTASTLNVRSGAGTNYSVVTKVYKGDKVNLLESSNGWYKVKLSNGKVGWASSDYITKINNSNNDLSNNNSQSGTSISGYGKVTASTLNVRSGAGTNYSVVTKVYKGDKVNLLESSNGWYKVKLSNGKVGWASSDYITKINNSNNDLSNNNSQSGTSISGYGKVTASTLNVRSGAGTSYSVVTKAYKGDKVELLESSNGWYKIKLSSGKVGWASSDYITKINNSNNDLSNNNSQSGTSISGYGKVTASTLNVRSGAGTSYSVVTKAYKGDKVELLESLNGWYKIKLSSGKIGWASSDYITKIDNSNNNTENETPSIDKAQAIVNLAMKQLGKPYVWGAEGPNSFDCSGLIYYVYKNAAGISLPRTSIEQSRTGTTISMSNLKLGDLIFSSTDGSGSVNHVGIYVGNNEMIHAPKAGDVVKKSKMNTSYWIDSYVVSKRVL